MGIMKTYSAYEFDIEYYNKSEWNNQYTITDENGEPVSFSGKVIRIRVKKHPADSNYIIDIGTDSGEVNIVGVNNNIIVPSGDYELPDKQYHFEFYNETDDEPIGFGRFLVVQALSE